MKPVLDGIGNGHSRLAKRKEEPKRKSRRSISGSFRRRAHIASPTCSARILRAGPRHSVPRIIVGNFVRRWPLALALAHRS